jgi:hypothetical protein
MNPERIEMIAHTGSCTPQEAQELARMLMEAKTRNNDGPTSQKAARSVRNMTQKRQDVMATFRRFGTLTDEQLVTVYATMDNVTDQSESGLRTRRNELVKMGLLVDTGNTRRIRSGRQAVLWGMA